MKSIHLAREIFDFALRETMPENRTVDQILPGYSSGGVYVNYLGEETDEGSGRIEAAYGPEKNERLVALKNKFDPTNLFRLNQNIRPTVV